MPPGDYDFLEVLAKNVSRSWTTLRLPHFGHFRFLSSYSRKESVSRKVLPHFAHRKE
jgi:hypothetical protein